MSPHEQKQVQSASQELRQEQKASPRLYQMMELVNLPLLQLQQRLRQEMQTNPFLELTELDDVPVEEESLEEIEGEGEEDVDWDEVLTDGFDAGGRKAEYEEREEWRPTPRASQDMPTKLTEDFHLLRMDPVMRALGEEIIGNLDERGYLAVPLTEIARSVADRMAAENVEETSERPRPTIHDAHAALRRVQELDPAGVGARNLRECLLLQLRAADEEGTLAWTMLAEHFDALVRHSWSTIIHDEGYAPEEVQAAADRIALLTPHPAPTLAEERSEYVIPDVLVRKIDGRYHVLHNDSSLPRLRIASAYREIASNPDQFEGENRAFIRKKLAGARWVVQAIEQRRRTVKRVMETIVEIQKPFFEEGIEKMRPLTRDEVAQEIDMHESTVARVANKKYADTPRGTYPISYFFSPGLSTDYGEEVSTRAVKARIREMVDAENPTSPLTDQEIADRLKRDAGIRTARRTVAKYRKQLGILGSRRRKRAS